MTSNTFSDRTPLIRGTTDVLFIIANPIAQVKAPQALNLVFASAGVDAVMVPARVNAERLGSFVREALAVPNVRGTLVSIPFKTPLMSLLDRYDPDSLAAGAVNAVRRGTDGLLEGALFDGAGFVGALNHHQIAHAGRRALLLGAGGAGLAIASALARCTTAPAELAVFDPDLQRAKTLAERIGSTSVCSVRAVAESDPADFELVINATPLGLNPGDPLPLDPQSLHRGQTVVDILMKDRPTPLEEACIARGVSVFTGHEMMVQQVPAYLEFFGYPQLARELAAAAHPVMAEVRQAIVGKRRPVS